MTDTNTENGVVVENGVKKKPVKRGWGGVIAIVFVLLAVFIFLWPSLFCDYTVRTRVAEGLVLASTYKNYVVDYYFNNDHQFPHGTPEEVVLQVNAPTFQATANTQKIAILDGGVIEIEVTEKAARARGKKLFLIPSVMTPGGRVEWRCLNGTGDAAFKRLNDLPSECRG